jgi:hypothetical protein
MKVDSVEPFVREKRCGQAGTDDCLGAERVNGERQRINLSNCNKREGKESAIDLHGLESLPVRPICQ